MEKKKAETFLMATPRAVQASCSYLKIIIRFSSSYATSALS